FLLTAGHCAYPYNDTSPKLFYRHYGNLPFLIGAMESYSVTPIDVALANPKYVEYFIIGSIEIISTNVHICKSGFSTGITCGYVKSLYAATISEDGLRIGGLITTVYSYLGDSGGSMFQFSYSNYSIPFVYAVGILSGGNHNSYEATTYCEPIRTAFAYGYILVHYPH
ncbi:33450_t:CDS:2, partial [Racocetra persica]